MARVNALFRTASRLTYFDGPAVGGLLLAAIGAPGAMLVDAATFAVSFALVALFVPGRPVARPVTTRRCHACATACTCCAAILCCAR